MARLVYSATRNLHLYLGLFISPFILVFAFSVFSLVHSWLPGNPVPVMTRTQAGLLLPAGLESTKGKEQLTALHAVLAQLDVRGEIWNVRQIPRERRFTVSVNVPGVITEVDLRVEAKTATVVRREPGVWEALVYLHKTPGPHLVEIRGNSAFMKAWRWLTDITVYVLLFITVSGVYLWTILRAERRIGLGLLAAGALTLGGMIYALIA